MNRNLLLGIFLVSGLVACKKEEAPPPPPVQQEVVAPAATVVPQGMEAENPAEKEGKP